MTKQRTGKPLLLLLMIASLVTASAQNINKPNKMGPLGTQANTYSGNLFIPRTDIFIPARGFDMVVAFNYNSYSFNQNSGYGNGWSFEYSINTRTIPPIAGPLFGAMGEKILTTHLPLVDTDRRKDFLIHLHNISPINIYLQSWMVPNTILTTAPTKE